MNTIKRLLVTGAFAALVFTIPGLAQQVETDYDHSAKFTQYHTYCWGRVHSVDPLFENRIREAVDRNLQTKGWQLSTGDCDVTLTAVAIKRSQKEYTTFYDGLGGGWRWHGWGGGMAMTTVDNVPVGTLILDMYDTRSRALLWRGMAHDQLSDKPDKDTKKLEKAVDKMFDKFPPRSY